MTEDPYTLLGVARNANAETIKAAFRMIARGCHPDLHPEDPRAEAQFKAASAAAQLLLAPDLRARYDRGEVDASGHATARAHYQSGASATRAQAGKVKMSDIFSDFVRNNAPPSDTRASDTRPGDAPPHGYSPRRNGGTNGTAEPGSASGSKGEDRHYSLSLSFEDAIKGTKLNRALADGKKVTVVIPPGTRDGQTLRLAGRGAAGAGGGPRGDALISLTVEPHAYFDRDGDDVLMTLPIALDEAVLGAQVEVPTLDGPVMVSIPPGTNSGRVLRLRGRGAAPAGDSGRRGDQLATLWVTLPEALDPELQAFVTRWSPAHGYDPREGMFS